MPTPRSALGSVLYDGKIYTVGGWSEDGYSGAVEIYDVASDSWSAGATCPLAAEVRAVLHGDDMIVIGGYDGVQHSEIYSYNIPTAQWSLIGNAPVTVGGSSGLEIVGDYIFVIGDFDNLTRVNRYNITDGTWDEPTAGYMGRRHTSTVVLNDRLYVIAGNSHINGAYQYYRVVQSMDVSQLTTSVSKHKYLPQSMNLEQNYPNPFNPSTRIRTYLDKPGAYQLNILNLKGQMINSYNLPESHVGEYIFKWDGRDLQGNPVPSSEYLYQLVNEDGSVSRKMMLIR